MHNVNRFASPRSLALLALALALPLAPAAACELSYGKFGQLQGNCRLSDFLKKYQLDVEVYRDRPQVILQLPNLQVAKLKWQVFGSAVEFYLDARNVGPRDAAAFEVAAVVTIMAPAGGGVGNPQSFTGSFPGLAAGAANRVYLGTVFLPDRNRDYDLAAMATVDPPAANAWGQIIESDEADNVKVESCRVYGPTPDLTGPPACD